MMLRNTDRIKEVSREEMCYAEAPSSGYICTLAIGHDGNHKAGGCPDRNGWCQVHHKWPQEPKNALQEKI